MHDYDSRASRSRFTSIPFCDNATILHDSILPALISDSASCESTILLHQELVTTVPLDITDALFITCATRRYRRTLIQLSFLFDFSIHSIHSTSLFVSIQAIIQRSAAHRSTIYQSFTFDLICFYFTSRSHSFDTASYDSGIQEHRHRHSTPFHQKTPKKYYRQCHSTTQTHFYSVHDFDPLIPFFL